MKIKYDPDADVLMFVLKQGVPANALSEPGGVIVSYDEQDEPITLEFLNASKRQLIDTEERFVEISR
ncbi:MAG: DUF2283 domain-containing protein [Microcystaceae cyanobacterium]